MISFWRTVTLTRARPGSSGATYTDRLAVGVGERAEAVNQLPIKFQFAFDAAPRAVARQGAQFFGRCRRARSSMPARSQALNKGPGNSKNCRCRFPGGLSELQPPSTASTAGPMLPAVPHPRHGGSWTTGRRSPISNQSYSSAGRASSASRKARWMVRSCSRLARSSSARRCASMISISLCSSGANASEKVVYAKSLDDAAASARRKDQETARRHVPAASVRSTARGTDDQAA